MSTGIKHIDNACGDLKDGRLYCIACTSYVDRLSILAEVAIGVLSKQTGLAIISNEYERPKLIEKLKQCYHSYDRYSGALTLCADYQPASSYEHIRSFIERIIRKDRDLLHILIVDNLCKVETDFDCSQPHLRIAANLYLLKMIAVEYDIPVVAFTEFCSNESICTTFADSEYIERMVICRLNRERLPKATRHDVQVISTNRCKQHTEMEVPLLITNLVR